jgi:Putative Ig domain
MAQPIWITPSGSLGTYPFSVPLSLLVVATPVLPATSLTYSLLAGSLPSGTSLNTNLGLIAGTPALVTSSTTYTFTIRATDNLGNIRDRTFSIGVTGNVTPAITTPSGVLLTTQDSVWTQIQLQYSNPDPTNPVLIELQEGSLPPGLEINALGLIQGYPQPPTINVTLPLITTIATQTEAATNSIYCLTISGITPGRQIVFDSGVFGGIVAGQTYYVKTINTSNNTITVSITQNGETAIVSDDTGVMSVTLPPVSQGQPAIRTFSFVIRLLSPLGGNVVNYSITVVNQNTPVSQGGPGKPPNSRIPTLLNTRPLTITINPNDTYYGYYILPPVSPSVNAEIGTIQSDNFFAFKLIGYDFDGNPLQYIYNGLPSWLTGDPITGWITGNPQLSLPGLNNYSFTVSVRKSSFNTISSQNFNFAFNLSKDITGKITWLTPSNLGSVFNEEISTLKVAATCDTPIDYRIVDGSLPPNLTLLSNGEITGYIASQPTSSLLAVGDNTTFTFTVEAYSPSYGIINSQKTFTLNVVQEFGQPTDILYIKAAPSLPDRVIIDSLLQDTTLIPDSMVYRADDINFGKANDVVYEHAYGIYASDIQEYLASITINHYWRNITLGELKTAVAKDSNGNIIYEVVYSQVIDNLQNPQGVSVSKEINWPRPIDLGLGPWYTSITDIFTSYETVLGQSYYTSLSPGYARNLYPNSLYNMRTQVADVLGQEYNSKLLPLWMTSQQDNGSTLGYTQAWVICYTKPGFSDTVKTNINNNWGYVSNGIFVPYTLNLINFQIDRFSVNKSTTYNYDKGLNPPAWTSLPSAVPVPDPIDSKDFYVLFPRTTILPDKTQY